MDFMDLPCNCNARMKVNRNAGSKVNAANRQSFTTKSVSYARCRTLGIPNKNIEDASQPTPTEICALVNKNKTSDTFAKHFAAHYPNRKEKLTTGEARKIIEVNIEWQGKAISCNKSF